MVHNDAEVGIRLDFVDEPGVVGDLVYVEQCVSGQTTTVAFSLLRVSDLLDVPWHCTRSSVSWCCSHHIAVDGLSCPCRFSDDVDDVWLSSDVRSLSRDIVSMWKTTCYRFVTDVLHQHMIGTVWANIHDPHELVVVALRSVVHLNSKLHFSM